MSVCLSRLRSSGEGSSLARLPSHVYFFLVSLTETRDFQMSLSPRGAFPGERGSKTRVGHPQKGAGKLGDGDFIGFR